MICGNAIVIQHELRELRTESRDLGAFELRPYRVDTSGGDANQRQELLHAPRQQHVRQQHVFHLLLQFTNTARL